MADSEGPAACEALYCRCKACGFVGAQSKKDPPECLQCGRTDELERARVDEVLRMSVSAVVGRALPIAEFLLAHVKAHTPGPVVAIAALDVARRELITQVKSSRGPELCAELDSQIASVMAELDELEAENEALGPFFNQSSRGSA